MPAEVNYECLLLARCHHKQPVVVAVTESGLICVGVRVGAGLLAGAWVWGSGPSLPALGAGARHTSPRVGVGVNQLRPSWGWARAHCAPVGDGSHFADSQWGQLPKLMPQLFPGSPGTRGPWIPGLGAVGGTYAPCDAQALWAYLLPPG